MQVYHISAECYPVAKVGGLGDVVGALPKYLNQAGFKSHVVIPGHETPFVLKNQFEVVYQGEISLGNLAFHFNITKEISNQLSFELYLINIPELFDRPNVYSYPDDTERFLAFQIAFLNWLIDTNQHPDLIHCHDHHTALIPFMIQFCFRFKQLKQIATVITIHNAQYQGSFGFDKLNYFPDFERSKIGFLEWGGSINPLASGIKCAWKVTTVSPSYLNEISEKANGLENLLRFERHKSQGILNGIDTEVWNPQKDSMIEANYSVKNLKKGKSINKSFLCESYFLNPNKPLFAFIGRLVWEKGADILPQAISLAFQKFGQEINILVLGSGEVELENELRQLHRFYGGNYNFHIGYNEKLAHTIYAGADFLLMPSRVEPCGLNQMYSLRYGTIPIVRRTGGLKDTVLDVGDGGFGICHDQVSVFDMIHSISRAIALFFDTKQWDQVRKEAMEIDHSWESVAKNYMHLYQNLKYHTHE